MSVILVLLISLIFLYTFITGLHDGGNVIATIVSSRSLSPKKILILAAVTEFAAPLFMGTAVAATMAGGIVKTQFLQSQGTDKAYLFIFCAITGAIIWNAITWKLGLPSSSSHALIGGMIGSGICIFGLTSIAWYNVLFKIVLMLLLSPVMGLLIGFLFMIATNRLCKEFDPKVNRFFRKSQYFSAFFLAASHGTNDSQKSMGIIALVLMISGINDKFYVPFWVQAGSSLMMALGLYLGGWKIVKTVGRDIFRMRPIHSFVSQISAGLVIFISGALGSPVSASQIVSSSIMGVGAGEKINAVRWQVAKRIMTSWFTTIPAAAIISIMTYSVFVICRLGA